MPNEIIGNTALPDGHDLASVYYCAGPAGCGRLISRERELEAFKTGIICPCGNVKYAICNTFDAEPQPDGNYLVKGKRGESFVIEKEVFEAEFKPVGVQ